MTATTEALGVQSVTGTTIPDVPHVVEQPRPLHVPRVAIPDAVAVASDRHAHVLGELVESRFALEAAEKALVDARAADIVADADRIAAGKQPSPAANRSEGPAQERLAEHERRRLVLTAAAARSYAALEDAIRDALDSWLPDVQAVDAEATEAFSEALDALELAAVRLAETRGAVRWLTEASESPSRALPMSTAGGKLPVTLGMRSDWEPAQMVAALRQAAVGKAKPPQHATGAEARFGGR